MIDKTKNHKEKPKERFIVIDGNALLHRAWHALPPMTTRKGEVVNAIYGFMLIFLKVLKDFRPDYLAVTFDRKPPTFRHKLYKEYKATRVKQPVELYSQLSRLKELLEVMNVAVYEKDGYEADDLIGTLAGRSAETEDIIVTGDMDTLQLVDADTRVYALKKGITDLAIYDEKAVKEKYELDPRQLIDYKALAGDPSDNVPGVKGIGKKTATDLIKRFGSLEKIYRHLEECERENKDCQIKEKTKNLLLAQKEGAFLSKELVTIVRDAPVEFGLGKCRMQGFDREKLAKIFQELEFKSLLNKIPEIAGERSGEKEEILSQRDYEIVDTEEEFQKFSEELKKQKSFAFYLEIGGFDLLSYKSSQIKSLNFCWAEGKTYQLPIANFQFSIFNYLKPVFANPEIEKYGYDLKSAGKILKENGLDSAGMAFDVKIAAYLLDPGKREYLLEDIIFQELGREVKKENTAKTAECILKLQEKLEEQLREKNLSNLFERIEMPLIPVLVRMEISGIKIDDKLLKQLSGEWEKELEKLEKEIFKIAGGKFNVNSPLQLKKILFEKLQILTSGVKKIKTGFSTAAPELEKLRSKHKIIDLIFQYREFSKLKSTYADALVKLADPKTKRVHANFNQTITATGRLSSSDPNLQNIPIKTEVGRQIRRAFIAEKGFQLVSADYSQIELRIIASLANDLKMMEFFQKGEDIHTRTAAEVFGCDLKEVTREMRRRAKVVNFGVIYGMSVYGLSQSAGISNEEAEDFIDRYFEVYRGIKEYIEQTKDLARSLGYAETIFGRRRYLPEMNSGVMAVRLAAERMAINMPVQGTAADLTKLAMIEINQALEKKYGEKYEETIKMILQVHDELVFEVRKDKVKEAAKIIKEAMENPAPEFKLKVPIEVKISAGKNWEEMDPVK